MKLCLYRIFFFISIISVFFNIFWALWQNSFTVGELTYISSPLPVTIEDKAYVLDNDTILIHNGYCGIFQCFDFDGNFIWGIHLQATKNVGGTSFSYNNGKLYFWESATDTIYTYEDFQLVAKETDGNIMSDKTFQSSFPMEDNEYICKFIWNGSLNILDSNDNIVENTKLDTKFHYYTIISAWIGFFFSMYIFLLLKQKIEQLETQEYDSGISK